MEQKKEFNQLAYVKNYNKENYKNYNLRLNKFKHDKVIDHMEKIENKNRYLINLILEDMQKKKK